MDYAQAKVDALQQRLTREHATHDAAWSRYMRAHTRVRADRSYRHQETFWAESAAVARSQERMKEIEGRLKVEAAKAAAYDRRYYYQPPQFASVPA